MDGKTFQNLRVSSPAPVTMLWPHGLIDRYSTRYEWPVSVWTFCIVGYFQRHIWFSEYPCVLTISCVVFENIKLQTCEPVSIACRGWSVWVFQKRIWRSAVPPPVASKPFWWGDQPMALTAAVCSRNFTRGCAEWRFQIISLLSLPPDASCWLSKLHFRPQTSCLWPSSVQNIWFGSRKSRIWMLRSRLPVATIVPFQAIELTRLSWPFKVLTSLQVWVSQIFVNPECVPTARWPPRWLQFTEVIASLSGTSHSFFT